MEAKRAAAFSAVAGTLPTSHARSVPSNKPRRVRPTLASLRREGTPSQATRKSAPASYIHLKRAIDVLVAAFALLVLQPLLIIVALTVMLSSPGPAIYRQTRVGKGGRRFKILKFRSMYAASDGPLLTRSGDVRVTAVGRVLRRSKLDELPQLWNVLVGEMSLVGPRPQTERYVNLFPAEYARILTVRPGITDFASIHYRNEEDLLATCENPEAVYIEEVLPRKFAFCNRYLEEMSFRTDAWLLLRTAAAIFDRGPYRRCPGPAIPSATEPQA